MPEDTSTADAKRILPDDSRIQWKDATSEKGVKFKIGTLKPLDSDVAWGNEANIPGPTKGHTSAIVTHDEDGIYWPVSTAVWEKPAQRIQDKFDIEWYYLTKYKGFWYDYVLHIENSQNWSYTFYDETGDGYGLTTWRTGDHWVCYDSDKPTIRRIKGTS